MIHNFPCRKATKTRVSRLFEVSEANGSAIPHCGIALNLLRH